MLWVVYLGSKACGNLINVTSCCLDISAGSLAAETDNRMTCQLLCWVRGNKVWKQWLAAKLSHGNPFVALFPAFGKHECTDQSFAKFRLIPSEDVILLLEEHVLSCDFTHSIKVFFFFYSLQYYYVTCHWQKTVNRRIFNLSSCIWLLSLFF